MGSATRIAVVLFLSLRLSFLFVRHFSSFYHPSFSLKSADKNWYMWYRQMPPICRAVFESEKKIVAASGHPNAPLRAFGSGTQRQRISFVLENLQIWSIIKISCRNDIIYSPFVGMVPNRYLFPCFNLMISATRREKNFLFLTPAHSTATNDESASRRY